MWNIWIYDQGLNSKNEKLSNLIFPKRIFEVIKLFLIASTRNELKNAYFNPLTCSWLSPHTLSFSG